ncbi:MAG: putative membrane protein YkgB [Candidatus Paceibacteria bacterium]|jgi:uncharacterized membrane protein YkgB
MNIDQKLHLFDDKIIQWIRKIGVPFGRFSLFLVYFWFGILKIIGTSAANPLVESLLGVTTPWIPFATFAVVFGAFEMFVGILFLRKGAERLAIFLMALHMLMTFLPLILLPEITWQAFLTPTVEGQYIIKNLVFISLGMGLLAHLHPLKKQSK